MAGDLIPPSSPAGRPQPDALEPAPLEHAAQFADPPPRAPAPAEREQPSPPSRYRSRFAIVTGALAGVAAIAIAIAVIAIVRAGGGGAAAPAANGWSAWHPTSSDPYAAATQIAAHVGREYRLNDGSQLDTIQSGPLQVNGVPMHVVVRSAAGDIVPISGRGMWYVLSGLGSGGSIEQGTPSARRLSLLKREALELALYTFRYSKGLDYLVTVLPPAPQSSGGANVPSSASTPLVAFLFTPRSLGSRLSAPLVATIPQPTPRPGTLSALQASRVDSLTARNVFMASIHQVQSGTVFLVLDRAGSTAAGAQSGSGG